MLGKGSSGLWLKMFSSAIAIIAWDQRLIRTLMLLGYTKVNLWFTHFLVICYVVNHRHLPSKKWRKRTSQMNYNPNQNWKWLTCTGRCASVHQQPGPAQAQILPAPGHYTSKSMKHLKLMWKWKGIDGKYQTLAQILSTPRHQQSESTCA